MHYYGYWLLRLFSILALLVCIGVSILWATSYNGDTELAVVKGQSSLSEYRTALASSHGFLIQRRVHIHRYWAGNTAKLPDWWPQGSLYPECPWWLRRLGFRIEWRSQIETPYPGAVATVCRDVFLPYWALLVVAAVVPLFSIVIGGLVRWNRGNGKSVSADEDSKDTASA